MWMITYHAVPKPGTSEFEKSGGAYVNCWILYAWQDGAEHLSRYEVEKEWTITETVEISWVEEDDIDEDNREYFEQALIDGGTFVFNMYPLNAADADDEDLEPDEETGMSEKQLKTNH